ncbi:MAG: glycosyltransferase, partial [Actinomycetota bacterium]
MNDRPPVRVVVLSFDGGQMTIDCLESLLATDWPADALEIVMVDNGSLDDVTQRVRNTMPRVRILEPLANLGFAGGCNLGMEAPTLDGFEPSFVALVNNDATVDPDWLNALHGAMSAGDDIGAVSAKMLFADRFIGAEFEVLAPGPHEPLPSVCLTALRLDGRPDYDRISFDEGVFGLQPPEFPELHEIQRWTAGRGSIRIAHDPREGT